MMNLKPVVIGAVLALTSLSVCAQPELTATTDWMLNAKNPQAHIQFSNLDPNKTYLYACSVINYFFQGVRIKLDRDIVGAGLNENELKLKRDPSKSDELDNTIKLVGSQSGNEKYYNSLVLGIKGDQKELNISLVPDKDESAEIQKMNANATLSVDCILVENK
jgi:hypothetical protein